MLFFSKEKNLVVNSKKTHKIIARFKEGRFETDDPVLIEKLKPYFRHREKARRKESKKKGKTFEQMYGKKRARKMKLKISKTLRGVS